MGRCLVQGSSSLLSLEPQGWGWEVPRGGHTLSCDLLLHLGMVRCHVPSSWQTAVKESSTWFPCVSRGRGAISTGATTAPVLPFPRGSSRGAKISVRLADLSTPVTLASLSPASPLRPEVQMGALSHTADSQNKG